METMTQPDGMADDLSGKMVTLVGGPRIIHAPTRLQVSYIDKAQ